MRTNTAWFKQCGWGVFTHYLADRASARGPTGMTPDEWNRRVDHFDVPGLVAQLGSIGAPYYLITLGQNSGFYCSPNETYDALVGERPSRLSKRDLVGELAEALSARGIRLLVYLPSHAPAHHRQAVENLRCTPSWDASAWQLKPGTYLRTDDVDERLSAFQRNWEAVVGEWSQRWGDKVHGWWIDGCYHADRMYRYPDPPNFASFAQALRAGNPDSIVAFNPGVRVPVVCHSEHEDYAAGEISNAFPVCPGERLDGAQYHVLSYLGQAWGRGPLRFPDEFVVGYTRHVNARGGVVTWDVPIEETGRIPQPFLDQLALLRVARGG
jgi:alpha-L-fucosidase